MKNVISYLSQIEMLVTIAMSISVWFLLNLNFALFTKLNRLAVKKLTTHCVTHGLSHCLDTSSLVLKISDQNKVFSFAYLKKINLKANLS